METTGLLLGGLALPFDKGMGKIHKLRNEGLRELEAPWLVNP